MLSNENQFSLQLIKELCVANGISGFEDEVVEIAKKYADDFAICKENTLRSLTLKGKNHDDSLPSIMLDAHSDELGFIVQNILPNGAIKFLPIGGWVAVSLPSSKVRVYCNDGSYITGVVASKPPHFMKDGERQKLPNIADLIIDIGSTSYKETTEIFGIELGAPIIPDVDFEFNEKNGVIMTKALDNRIGCALVIETMKNLHNINLEINVVGSLSSQEEVGGRGIPCNVNELKPDVAIVFEGTPADDTFLSVIEAQGCMKKGPQIRHYDKGMISNPRFTRLAKQIARENGIPFQEAVRSGGSTNGKSIHLAQNGIPCIVIGVPTRYAHSHHCFSALDDYTNSLKLASKIIMSLNRDIIDSL